MREFGPINCKKPEPAWVCYLPNPSNPNPSNPNPKDPKPMKSLNQIVARGGVVLAVLGMGTALAQTLGAVDSQQ